jgi:hypothetical protein
MKGTSRDMDSIVKSISEKIASPAREKSASMTPTTSKLRSSLAQSFTQASTPESPKSANRRTSLNSNHSKNSPTSLHAALLDKRLSTSSSSRSTTLDNHAITGMNRLSSHSPGRHPKTVLDPEFAAEIDNVLVNTARSLQQKVTSLEHARQELTEKYEVLERKFMHAKKSLEKSNASEGMYYFIFYLVN